MEGGLRVDIQDPTDWLMLRQLLEDALDREVGLAQALGEGVGEPEILEDWREFVLPELEQEFTGAVARVGTVLTTAAQQCEGPTGCLWITREDGFHWYSTLNQARLAIEERYRFGDRARDDLELLDDTARQSAWYRSQFYSALQGLLLQHVLA